MAEVLVRFTDPIIVPGGTTYVSRVCGREMADGKWEG